MKLLVTIEVADLFAFARASAATNVRYRVGESLIAALTSDQAGVLDSVNEALAPEGIRLVSVRREDPACLHCGDSHIELVNGGNGNVLEVPCSWCPETIDVKKATG